nr:PKD domain-containing protein [Bacteroidota bacterium]
GDETTGYILFLRLIDYLLSNYGTNDQVTHIVNNAEIWINPLSNPDGTYAGGNNSVYGATRYNSNYVDMNRNYPDPQDGPHPDGEEWQPETIAFMQMAEENTFVMGGNTHGGAEVLNYPWDTWPQLAADDSWWVFVCREYADTVHQYAPSYYLREYENGITNGYAWYTIDGGRQDYMNYFHNCRELTMEISGTKLLPANQLENHWDWNYRSLLSYIEQCTFGVNGVVTDLESGEPLHAQILIEGHDIDNSFVYSDPNTGFYQRLLDNGTYDITFSAPGHMPVVIENVYVSRYATTNLNVQLDAGELTADFSVSSSTVPIGAFVGFTDESYGNPVSWNWTFDGGEPATSTQQNPEGIQYNNAGSFDVSLTVYNQLGDSETVTKTDFITVNAEYIMSDQTITTCTGLFYDTGGETNAYSDNEDFTMTFLPGVTGAEIIAEFLEFDVEFQSSCTYDWLKIYDGATSSATLLGAYCGTDNPGIIEASNVEGALTFEFHSDYSQTESGWKAAISCTSVPLLPVANFTADTNYIIAGESIHFTDLTTNNPTSWAWSFQGGTPASSSEQNPEILYLQPGIYDVSLIVQNEVGSDIKSMEGYITVDSAIGIDDLNESNLLIYPNPVTDNFLMVISPEIITQVDIVNPQGKTLSSTQFNTLSAQVGMARLSPGIYFVKVYTNSGVHIQKVCNF